MESDRSTQPPVLRGTDKLSAFSAQPRRLPSATVHDLNAARAKRKRLSDAELYRRILDSVKHLC